MVHRLGGGNPEVHRGFRRAIRSVAS